MKTFLLVFLSSMAMLCHAEWNYASDIDEITDERKVYIATETKSGSYDLSKLFIRFTFPKLKKMKLSPEIFIVPAAGRYETETFFDDYTSGIIRFDNEEPINVRFSRSTDGESIFFTDPDTILELMKKHDKLIVRYDNHGPKTIRFDISDLNKHLEKANPSLGITKPTKNSIQCKTCNNRGKISTTVHCPKCLGSGIYREKYRNGKMSYSVEMPCDKCNNGEITRKIPCPDCNRTPFSTY